MKRVLILDDSLTVRMDLDRAFKDAGWITVLCATAGAARQTIGNDRIDAIVADVLPTDMDGTDFLRRIEEDPATATIPVIRLWSPTEVAGTARPTIPGADDSSAGPYDSAFVVARASEMTAARERAGPARPRILAVDDSPTYLHELAQQLTQDDYEVVPARSGEEALDLLETSPVNCILLDLMMPGMSGHEICRRIKHSPSWRSIPVVMLTASEEREAMTESFEAGADDYVPKSGDLSILRARLRAQLRRKQFEDEHLRIREALYRKEIEVTEARGARQLAETRAGLLADLQQKNQELETAKLAAERAKAVAEEASRAKDHFMAVVSHELRTPLTPVLAGIALLQKDTALHERARERLQVMRRNVELEARLIDDLLDLTRIVRGKVELNKQPVELGSIIDRALEVCRPDIEARRLHFGMDFGSRPYPVHADAARLQQVFWNIIKNSVKFTPQGGCVGLLCRSEGGQVVVEITDTGIGIEPSALTRIFDAFVQSGPSITREFGGLGLGLAISRGLIEAHGGTVEALSEGPGKGATFRVRLPMIAAGTRQAEGAAAAHTDAHEGANRRKVRVLLVEDHGDTADAMTVILELEGHEVQTAGDVATALDFAARSSFDIIVSDLSLPDGSGLDLMRELRSRGHNMPGIALTGYGREIDMQQSRAAGFQVHLVKPVDVTRLVGTIDRLVAR